MCSVSSTHRLGGKLGTGVLPSIFDDFPCRLGDKSGKGEPVVVLVFLEIRESDHEEMVQQGRVAFGNYVFPDL